MINNQCLKCLRLLKGGGSYGLHAKCFSQWFKTDASAEFEQVTRQTSESAEPTFEKDERWNSSFFQGKFRKYSAVLGKHSYILKVCQSIAPELPNVEYLCNQLAQLLDIEIPDYYLIDYYGERTFVTKNFIDHQKSPARLTHIYHFVKTASDYRCEQLLKVINAQTKQFSDIKLFINTCLFDALIGNHDRHGRNLGFIVTPHATHLSPIYDNTTVLGLEQGGILKAHFEPKGKIATHASFEPTAKDYALEFMRLGYTNIVEDFITHIDMKKISALISKGFCSPLMKQAILDLITRRYEEYRNVLRKRS